MRLSSITLVLVSAMASGCVSRSENRATQFLASAPTPDSATAAAMTGPICSAVEGEAMPDGSNTYCYFRNHSDQSDEHSTQDSRKAFIQEKYKYLCTRTEVRSDAAVRSQGSPAADLRRVGFKCHR